MTSETWLVPGNHCFLSQVLTWQPSISQFLNFDFCLVTFPAEILIQRRAVVAQKQHFSPALRVILVQVDYL